MTENKSQHRSPWEQPGCDHPAWPALATSATAADLRAQAKKGMSLLNRRLSASKIRSPLGGAATARPRRETGPVG